jgi:FixJ family two-component response regulator
MHRDTVFIVDDDASVRDSLSLLLSLRGHATATFASAEDFLAALTPEWRGCVVADIRMPGLSGLELQRQLAERGPKLPLIIITAHGDVTAARQAFLADAVDFIEKPFDGEQLVQAVERALSGPRAPRPAPGRGAAALSAREREVMTLLVKGLHNRRIAEQLGISPRTVEVHKARVMDKLGVRTLVELVRLVDQGQV